jgi:hypothetical protein
MMEHNKSYQHLHTAPKGAFLLPAAKFIFSTALPDFASF